MDYAQQLRQINYAYNATNAVYGKLAQRYGLNYNSLMLLYALDEGYHTQKELCEQLQLSKSTVHSILFDFIKKGYMYLDEGANRKEKTIMLTEAGYTYMHSILDEINVIELRTMELLGPEICRQLTDTNMRFYEVFKNEVENEQQT